MKVTHFFLTSFLLLSVAFPNAGEDETPLDSPGNFRWSTLRRVPVLIDLMRGEWLLEHRLNPSGGADVNPITREWCEYLSYQPDHNDRSICPPISDPLCGVDRTPPWRALGPTRVRFGSVPYNNVGGLGRLNVLTFHSSRPGLIYAGAAAGGIWKSVDGGDSWRWLSEDRFDPRLMAISGIALDPVHPETIYILNGDGNSSISTVVPTSPSQGVLKSTDGGRIFRFTGLRFLRNPYHFGFKLAIDPIDGRVLFSVMNTGLYKTKNRAKTWRRVKEGEFRDFEWKPGDLQIAYASTTERIFRSEDGGDTWRLADFHPAFRNFDQPRLRRVEIAVTPHNPQLVYAIAGDVSGLAGFYRSEDSGKTFELISNTPNTIGYSSFGGDSNSLAYYALALAASPVDANEIYAGGINIWKSADGGTHWSLRSYWDNQRPFPFVHADIHGLFYARPYEPTRCPHPNGSKRPEFDVYAAHDGGISKSADGGRTWCDLTEGLRITQVYRICSGPGEPDVYYGAQDNGSNRLKNETARVVLRADGTTCLVDHRDPTTVYVSQQNGVLLKITAEHPNGVSVTPPVENRSDGSASGAFVTPFAMHPRNPRTIYGCYRDLWETQDGGTRWSNLTTGALTDNTCVAVELAPSDPRHIYVAKRSAVYVSRDGGKTWSPTTRNLPVGSANITDLAIAADDPQRVWVTFGGFEEGLKIYETRNGGKFWRNVSGCLPNVPTNTVLYVDNVGDMKNPWIFVGTDIGVFRMRDVATLEEAAASDDRLGWSFLIDLPAFIILDLESTQGRLRAATFAQGVWETHLHRDSPRRSEE